MLKEKIILVLSGIGFVASLGSAVTNLFDGKYFLFFCAGGLFYFCTATIFYMVKSGKIKKILTLDSDCEGVNMDSE
jgi:hypothetical protein